VKLTKAALVAIFAALPADVAGQCAATLNPCELALYESAVTWENRAKKTRLKLTTCLGKLEARSSTVTAALVVPELPEKEETINPYFLLIGAGFSGLLLGGLFGILMTGG
tara:strand:- start:1039 stop:1368 length:330 start_codon:yes stop_codon:yes gene_type:complete